MGRAKTLAALHRRTAASVAHLGAARAHGARRPTVCTLGISVALVACLACTQLQLSLRKPGERIKTFPEKVAAQYDCNQRPLPFAEIEKSDLVPTKLKPGGEFRHRIVYVMCPVKTTDVMIGTLHTRIHFEGHVIDQDDSAFKLKPGRWEVVNLFDVHKQAQPGVYSFSIEFQDRAGRIGQQLRAESTFIVQAP